MVGTVAQTVMQRSDTGAQRRERPLRLLYLVSEDWYFLSHRLPMARAARAAGYEVHVATRVVDGGAAIRAEGFTLHPLTWRRGSTNPLDFLQAVRQVRAVYRALKPDLVHQVALWPSIVGSVAALGTGITRLSALAGLGFSFTSRTAKARMVRTVMQPVLRWLLSGDHAAVLVQNSDDQAAIAALGVPRSKIFRIPGSGVDTDVLKPLPEPAAPVAMAYVGRLLADKGLRALINAHSLLAKRGEAVRLLIAGEVDPANPASIPPAEIESWRRQPLLDVLGQVPDISSLWARAHIAVLPSRREGLPKSLLEAAACGRPLVATDVPGCREIARAGLNALLVPVDDAQALADAVQTLAGDTALRARFGAAGRALVESEFSSERIATEIVALYRALQS
jgi:glycosyltransferase involved in cell wall biosynthesis